MSPKDLKTIGFIDRMADAGVRVFKIEGVPATGICARGRGMLFAGLEAICSGTFSEEKVKEWDARLGKIFNRGFRNGYYLGQRLGEWSAKYGSSATRTKVYAAKAIRHFPKIGVGEFQMEAGELRLGDEVVITGTTTRRTHLQSGGIAPRPQARGTRQERRPLLPPRPGQGSPLRPPLPRRENPTLHP